MVYADEYHSVLEQSGSVQAEARPITSQQLLPGLLRRERYQQSLKIPSLAIQPSQPSTSQLISPVSQHLNFDCTKANLGSLTQATDTSNIRLVFAAVKETILQNALKDSGIL